MMIAVAALIGALDRARQGATIADMRNLGTAIEAYNIDYGRPPKGVAFDTVSVFLVPYHNLVVPENDHWGNIYAYWSDDTGSYSLISFGKDGVDGDDLTTSSKGELERDIVMTDGRFPGLK